MVASGKLVAGSGHGCWDQVGIATTGSVVGEGHLNGLGWHFHQ